MLYKLVICGNNKSKFGQMIDSHIFLKMGEYNFFRPKLVLILVTMATRI